MVMRSYSGSVKLLLFATVLHKLVLVFHEKWVPVTTAWRVLRLRMEERPPIWRVVANILSKQSQAADNG
jgi:hypothetical protein